MDYLKEVFGRKQIKLAIAGAVSCLAGIILVIVSNHFSSGLEAQQMAERWSSDDDYAEVSCFFSELSGFDEMAVKELVYKVESKLSEDSITAPSENARLWLYAYSSSGQVTIASSQASSTVKAFGIGEDFFLFHPMDMVCGSYFDGTNVCQDLVLLDRETAWTLFGSTDVVGQIVKIGSSQFVVSGVYERASGNLNDAAGNNEPTIYMYYSAFKECWSQAYISCFEAMAPNPLTGYVKDAVKAGISVSDTKYEIVENTGRFKWTRLLQDVKNFGSRGMNSAGVVYPYWENMARGMEDYLTPVCVCACLLFLFPAVLVVMLLIRMYKKRTIHFNDIKNGVERKIEKSRETRRAIKRGDAFDED